MAETITRNNRKEIRNQRIVKRYSVILRRMGSVKFLTPSYEIMEEIANEFNIEATTVSRILINGLKERAK
jgi:aspartate/tyrosine/aromatic aminotransferase